MMEKNMPGPSVGPSQEIEDDDDVTPIRAELSKMSFEELQQLKQRLGSKVYNEAMFGTRKKSRVSFKRENKNRPREMSSKVRVPLICETTPKMKAMRDPRFDSLCGEYKETTFKSSYSFLNGIREEERNKLMEEMKTEEDPIRMDKIKYLIQRMENQDREERKLEKKKGREKMTKEATVEALRQGQKPRFRSKSEKRVVQLVGQFEDLKNSGKLEKHIAKQRKKMATMDRKKIELYEGPIDDQD